MDTSDLLVNLVVAITAGLIGALIAIRLRQSVVVGYLVAGLTIGPHTPGFVADAGTVDALANIGVILLLFAVGVQLSFRELLQVGRLATLGGLTQVVVMIAVGAGVGLALGWPTTQALFLGAVLSNSSSTIMSKVLSDSGEVSSRHGKIAIAWSSVQDFSTIALVILLTALSENSDGTLADLPRALAEASVFLLLLIPMGAYVFPWFFARVAKVGQREVLILSIAGVAFGTAYVSSFFGLSLALGAFAAGVAVAESDESHHIIREVLPFRDIFAALFFVSIGMLVQPDFVLHNLALVLLLVVLTVVVKGVLAAGISAVSGVPVITAVLTGALLAQSAEFSFLLARIGRDLDAVSEMAFSTMLAAAVVSIAIASSMYQLTRPAAVWLQARLPARLARPVMSEAPAQDLSGHVVICGYGRVGRVIGHALAEQHIPFVVIEEDREVVRAHAGEGFPVLLGSADNPAVLETAHIGSAGALVVTVPDPVSARQIVDFGRRAREDLPIVVRTHSESERQFLQRRGASEAVLGEHEIALEMIRRTLVGYSVGQAETETLIDRMRSRDSTWNTNESPDG